MKKVKDNFTIEVVCKDEFTGNVITVNPYYVSTAMDAIDLFVNYTKASSKGKKAIAQEILDDSPEEDDTLESIMEYCESHPFDNLLFVGMAEEVSNEND